MTRHICHDPPGPAIGPPVPTREGRISGGRTWVGSEFFNFRLLKSIQSHPWPVLTHNLCSPVTRTHPWPEEVSPDRPVFKSLSPCQSGHSVKASSVWYPSYDTFIALRTGVSDYFFSFFLLRSDRTNVQSQARSFLEVAMFYSGRSNGWSVTICAWILDRL
jgi:hypothetical protein